MAAALSGSSTDVSIKSIEQPKPLSTFKPKSQVKVEKEKKKAESKKVSKPGSTEDKHKQALSMNNKASKEVYAMAMEAPGDPK